MLLEFGPEKFAALYASLSRHANAQQVAATFLEHYDTDLDDVWEQVRADPNRKHCFPFWACQRSAGEPGTYELGATCTSIRSAIGLPDESAALLRSEAGVAFLRPCDAVTADSPLEYGLVPGQSDTLFFPNERGFAAQRYGDNNARFSFEPVSGQFADACDEAFAEPVVPTGWSRELYVAPTEAPLFLAYEVSEPATVGWRGNHQSLIAGEDPWTIEACRTCENGEPSDCSAPARSFEVTDRVWLRIAWEANDMRDTLLAHLSFSAMAGD